VISDRTRAFAAEMAALSGLRVEAAPDVQTAVDGASIVCTVSAAVDPILSGAWIAPGTHVNVVGSSGPMAAEIDGELVRASRFIVDHREHVLVHGGEFLRAKAQGLVGDDHIAAEIGQVLAGRKRRDASARIRSPSTSRWATPHRIWRLRLGSTLMPRRD
jgi:ornithine cyclodeaminase/alanine dehydrogenase-like protein (mu-crystallin family)